MHSNLRRKHSVKSSADDTISARLESEPVIYGLLRDAQWTSPCELTLRPTLDLFVFNLEHFRAIGVHGCDIRVGTGFIGPGEFRNIGLEFDPDWADICSRSPNLTPEDERIVGYFARSGADELQDATIYLIDYSIQCSDTILRWEHATGKDATAFIAREGRFVCLSYPGQYYLGAGDDDWNIYKASSFSFANMVREEIDFTSTAMYGSPWEDDELYHERTASIEVLAWIPSIHYVTMPKANYKKNTAAHAAKSPFAGRPERVVSTGSNVSVSSAAAAAAAASPSSSSMPPAGEEIVNPMPHTREYCEGKARHYLGQAAHFHSEIKRLDALRLRARESVAMWEERAEKYASAADETAELEALLAEVKEKRNVATAAHAANAAKGDS
ncbi:hypothetical protein K4F52_003844 [Lecanicillium sp. MT-2017a]|nr:hypothetical protein K4F52_003844 [Lecanicillium sp. MT-2017a]